MDRVLTIPNVISVVRLCCIPLFVWLLFGLDDETTAAFLLALLGTTDWIDGYIARRFNQISTVGKVLDPTADRMMLGIAGISLMVVGAMPVWFGIATLGREMLIGIGGVYLAFHGHKRLDVQYIGKVGAFALMLSFPLFLAAHGGISGEKIFLSAAWFCGVVGLIFNWYSLFGYWKRAMIVLGVKKSHQEDVHPKKVKQ